MVLFTTTNIVAFLTLMALEIVLGIDNVIFISILSNKLPAAQKALGQRLGIGVAVVSRLILLLAINWVQSLEHRQLFVIFGNTLSGKDSILLLGGLFLISKSTYEIHDKLEVDDKKDTDAAMLTLRSMVVQVVLIDVVFSLDSVITAVGISNVMPIMVAAIIIASGVMIIFAGQVGNFVERHPTMKMLALSFLILIGSLLVMEGWNPEASQDLHLKNYIYFAMAFSFVVELLNMKLRRTSEPVHLRNRPRLSEHGGEKS